MNAPATFTELRHTLLRKCGIINCEAPVSRFGNHYCDGHGGELERGERERELRHTLESATDPAVIALEAQAAAHVRAIQQHAARYMTAIRYGDPVLAQVEMGDVARRMVQCEQVVDRLAAQLAIDAPELRAAPCCGARECDCKCDQEQQQREDDFVSHVLTTLNGGVR